MKTLFKLLLILFTVSIVTTACSSNKKVSSHHSWKKVNTGRTCK